MGERRSNRPLVFGVAAVAALVAFIANLDYLAEKARGPFHFGELEMVQVFEGFQKRAEWDFQDGVDRYRVRFELRRVPGADWIRTTARVRSNVAHACTSRSFLQSAAACYDTTALPLEADGILEKVTPQGPLLVQEWQKRPAQLVAYGRTLHRVEFRVQVADGEVFAHSPDGADFSLRSVYLSRGLERAIDYQAPSR